MPHDERWRNSYDQWKTTDPALMPSVNRSQHGAAYARIRERDTHELWAACRQFRWQYGVDALDQVVAQSKNED